MELSTRAPCRFGPVVVSRSRPPGAGRSSSHPVIQSDVSRRSCAAFAGHRPGREVARGLGWSTSKVSKYELGRDTLPLDEVEKILDFYGVTDPERGQLLSLAREANERGWWEDYADALPHEYQAFIGLEAEAASAAIWAVEIIPGLLQTKDYARQVHLGYQAVVPIPPRIIDTRVKVRMIRQQVLTHDPPLELSVVLDESVLLRQVGKPWLMHAQLQHLLEMTNLPNIELRVLPLRKERPVANSFTMFGFNPMGETSGLHDVVETESTVGSQFTRRVKPTLTSTAWCSKAWQTRRVHVLSHKY